jgi:hypothetical protein
MVRAFLALVVDLAQPVLQVLAVFAIWRMFEPLIKLVRFVP